MTKWKKANKIIEWREPKPNAHIWKYVGRTPQGGLSGGDDIHECTLCGTNSLYSDWNGLCSKGEKGKVEVVELGYNAKYRMKKDRAVLGKYIIIKDEDGVEIILLKKFKEYYEVIAEPDLLCNVCGKLVYAINYCPRCGGSTCNDCFDVDADLCKKCLQEQ